VTARRPAAAEASAAVARGSGRMVCLICCYLIVFRAFVERVVAAEELDCFCLSRRRRRRSSPLVVASSPRAPAGHLLPLPPPVINDHLMGGATTHTSVTSHTMSAMRAPCAARGGLANGCVFDCLVLPHVSLSSPSMLAPSREQARARAVADETLAISD